MTRIEENEALGTDMGQVPEPPQANPTIMSGLTAAMEVAGVESIPGATPGRIMVGFSPEED